VDLGSSATTAARPWCILAGAGLHPVSTASLRAALFARGDLDIHPVEQFSEDEIDWADPATLHDHAPLLRSPELAWHNADAVVTGPYLGRQPRDPALEPRRRAWIRPVEDYAAACSCWRRPRRCRVPKRLGACCATAGERGLLEQFPRRVFGLPKASHFRPRPAARGARALPRPTSGNAVFEMVSRYNADAMIVFGVDIGHTDPQWVLPYGGAVTRRRPGAPHHRPLLSRVHQLTPRRRAPRRGRRPPAC
jgi:hypothetical protein